MSGKVLTNPGTVPTRLVFSNSRDNYTAVVGDISASCACGGYYYQVTLPNQRDYAVDVYFGNSTGTYLCKTVLHLSSDSSILTHLVRCP